MTENVMKALVATCAGEWGCECEGECEGECKEVRACDDYSGRGMYGKTTCAVRVADVGTLCHAVAEAIRQAMADDEPELADEIVGEAKRFRTDSLGRDMIVY